MQPRRSMENLRRPIRYRMVVALDDSEYAEIVLEHALDQAARHDTPDLHFVTVVHRESEVDARMAKLVHDVVDGMETFRGDPQTWRTRLHVRVGKPTDEIS